MSELLSGRRGFLGRLAAGAAAMGLGSLVAPVEGSAEPARMPRATANPEFEAWLNKITGKHKMIFDVPEPNDGFVFAWARVFLNTTNENYGTTDADNSAVIVLRHAGIPFAMESAMWAKYKFGQTFKITDPATKGPAIRHPLIHTKPGDLPIPGMATDELLAKGVLMGVCNVALTFYSMNMAKEMGMPAETIKKDWVASLLPGIVVVPSGVIAVNRTQEKGCAYCFAG
ncbi:MAG TPA: twin-arginine translocation signal domain-containing protein [Gemmatimonadales bacterium]|nr:twin-arginine translocation signal domain-containing protein [Gemmatimonadales bacterium]